MCRDLRGLADLPQRQALPSRALASTGPSAACAAAYALAVPDSLHRLQQQWIQSRLGWTLARQKGVRIGTVMIQY